MDHDIRDVPMHEHLSRHHADELCCRHTTVSAAYPEVSRVLLLRKLWKEIGITCGNALSPRFVLIEEMFEIFHRVNRIVASTLVLDRPSTFARSM